MLYNLKIDEINEKTKKNLFNFWKIIDIKYRTILKILIDEYCVLINDFFLYKNKNMILILILQIIF